MGKRDVACAARHVIEHKHLVTLVEIGQCHGLLLMRGDELERSPTAHNHRRPQRIRLRGHGLGKVGGEGGGMFGRCLFSPQGMALDNHGCSVSACAERRCD